MVRFWLDKSTIMAQNRGYLYTVKCVVGLHPIVSQLNHISIQYRSSIYEWPPNIYDCSSEVCLVYSTAMAHNDNFLH